jgi:hypothetical protein
MRSNTIIIESRNLYRLPEANKRIFHGIQAMAEKNRPETHTELAYYCSEQCGDATSSENVH